MEADGKSGIVAIIIAEGGVGMYGSLTLKYIRENRRRLWFLLLVTLILLVMIGGAISTHHALTVWALLTLPGLMLPSLILGNSVSQVDWPSAGGHLWLVVLLNLGYVVIVTGGLVLLFRDAWPESGIGRKRFWVYSRQVGWYYLVLIILGVLKLLIAQRWPIGAGLVPLFVPMVWWGYQATVMFAQKGTYLGTWAAWLVKAQPKLTGVLAVGLVISYVHLMRHKNRRIPKDSTAHKH